LFGFNLEDMIVYIAGLNEDILKQNDPPEKVLKGHCIAYKTCAEGKTFDTNYIRTSSATDVGNEGGNQPAFQCGLSTLLSYLCDLDKEIEPSIKGSSEFGYDFAKEVRSEKPGKKEVVEKLKRYAEGSCRKILKIFNVHAKPLAGARAYIYAAMDAGYELFVELDSAEEDGYHTYVTKEVVQEFQKPDNKPRLNGDNKLEDPFLDKFVRDYGRNWFFCKKKLGPSIYNP
jgi:hypothetical protein